MPYSKADSRGNPPCLAHSVGQPRECHTCSSRSGVSASQTHLHESRSCQRLTATTKASWHQHNHIIINNNYYYFKLYTLQFATASWFLNLLYITRKSSSSTTNLITSSATRHMSCLGEVSTAVHFAILVEVYQVSKKLMAREATEARRMPTLEHIRGAWNSHLHLHLIRRK